MSRTTRIVLTGVLTTGALVTGGIALAAGPAAVPSSPTQEVAVVEPAQNPSPEDCPWERGSDGATTGTAAQL